MLAEWNLGALGEAAGTWCVTYLLHSTLFVAICAVVCKLLRARAFWAFENLLWRVALLAPLISATVSTVRAESAALVLRLETAPAEPPTASAPAAHALVPAAHLPSPAALTQCSEHTTSATLLEPSTPVAALACSATSPASPPLALVQASSPVRTTERSTPLALARPSAPVWFEPSSPA